VREQCGCDGIGSLHTVRTCGPLGRVGSTPTSRTKLIEKP
jgi:hypothetical protein